MSWGIEYHVGSRDCWGSAWVLRAVPPAQSPVPRFQGDSSFVVMTNFIATPQQTQGYCAEVRTVHAPFFNPQGKVTWKRRSPWALEVKLDRLPAGATVVEFRA